MLGTVLLLLVGLACLILGGEALVRGASQLAVRLGLSSLFIGLTVVSSATSLPEMVVSLLAALRGVADIAVGNVIGSNIFNIGVVLGVGALVAPISFRATEVWRDLGVSIAATLAFAVLAFGGALGRLDAALLFAGLLAYLTWAYRSARRAGEPVEAGLAVAAEVALGKRMLAAGKSVALVVIGLGLLVAGANWAVESAVEIAEAAGLSRTVVGLTIVAAGTSLPELATSVVAALKREVAIAVGNVLGSNIFNLLGILGVAGLVHPLQAAPAIVRYDVPVILGFSLLVIPLMLTGRRVSRLEGLLLVVLYIAYCVWLLAVRGPAA